jgi:MFS family permease
MVKPIVARLGERRTLYIGQFFGAVGMVMAGLATNSLFYFLSIPVMMLWTISSPAAQGMMTRRVSESEQGELQGAIGSLASLAWIFGPTLFTFTSEDFCFLLRWLWRRGFRACQREPALRWWCHRLPSTCIKATRIIRAEAEAWSRRPSETRAPSSDRWPRL